MDSVYMEYDYLRYLEATIEEQSVLHNTVLSIVGESYNEAAELQVLTEGVIDKIKNGWSKFVAWLKKVWAKFLEKLSHTFSGAQGYLDKYKDIILKKKVKSGYTVEMPNHREGINRIFKTTVDVIQPNEIDSVFKVITASYVAGGNAGAAQKTVDEVIDIGVTRLPTWQKLRNTFGNAVDFSQDTDTIRAKLKQYFVGGEPMTYATDNSNIFNMSEMYEFCYHNEKIAQNIEKDTNAFYTTSDNITKTIENEMKKINNDVNNAKPADSNPSDAPSALDRMADAANHEAASIIHEADPRQKTDAASATANSSATSSSSSENRTTAVDASKNNIGTKAADSKDYENTGKSVGAVTDANTSSKADMTNIINTVSRILTRYRDECVSVLVSEMNAAKDISKDYMDLIRAHVNDYIGQPSNVADDKTPDNKKDYAKA